jgi:dolichyl-phosphate beta-glucosyltransferase
MVSSDNGKVFNILVQFIAIKGFKDTQCGFKCFKTAVAIAIFPRQHLTGFGFDVEVLYIARKAGYTIKEVPVNWINSPKSPVHIMKDSARVVVDLVRIRWNDLSGHYNFGKENERTSEKASNSRVAGKYHRKTFRG